MHELLRGLTSEDIRSNPGFRQVVPSTILLDSYVEKLEETVFGQRRACREIARALVRTEAGFISPNRPEFIALFAGEPGSGKTESAKAIAKVFDPKDPDSRLLVIDCASFSSDHEVTAKFCGSPPGYVGYGDKPLITPEFLAKRNVVVFDEVEKGHPALHKLLLGVMDRGELTAYIQKSGHHSDATVLHFNQTFLVCTSNIGSSEIRQAKKGAGHLGFHTSSELNQTSYEIGLEAIRRHWKQMPEFLNRFDAVTIFDHLTPPVFERIMDKFLTEFNDNQRYGQNYLAVTREVREWVMAHTDLYYGGRELKRAVEKFIITPAAEVKMSLKAHQPMIADIKDDAVVFWTSDPPPETRPEKPNLVSLEGGKKGDPNGSPEGKGEGNNGNDDGSGDTNLDGSVRVRIVPINKGNGKEEK